MRTFRIQSLTMVSLSLYHGELLSAKIMAGLLARDSSSGRLPGLSTSDVIALRPRLQRRVRGGLVPSAVHPSSLSSPCGHLDPIFNCFSKMPDLDSTAGLYESSRIADSNYIKVYQVILLRIFKAKPTRNASPKVIIPPTIPERLLPALLPSYVFVSPDDILPADVDSTSSFFISGFLKL